MTRIQQAGAIVIKDEGAAPLFLLVKAKRDPTIWIFPKGHIERGESCEETALREAGEEAGIAGTIIAPVGALEFESDGRSLHVDYFLVKWTGEVPHSEGRPTHWGTYEETRRRLSFENARELLKHANEMVGRLHGA